MLHRLLWVGREVREECVEGWAARHSEDVESRAEELVSAGPVHPGEGR